MEVRTYRVRWEETLPNGTLIPRCSADLRSPWALLNCLAEDIQVCNVVLESLVVQPIWEMEQAPNLGTI